MYISTREIRHKFLDFFANSNHTVVKSSSLVPHNDPSLMFVNSGMVQFKNAFTGKEKLPYSTAVSSQKAVRAGGKHNDLENVGYTTRHHTFFEMLGNFSFGDYFKEKAIFYAWQLLTKEFDLPKDRLYVTVYHQDSEAYDLWRKIANLSDERIIKIATNDNFWSMGDTGPCGPCSEIFYDHGEKIWGGLPGTAEQDGDRYVEIWNMVFMQYEQVDKHTRIELPIKSIDTGMGLERIASVLQGVHDNYETDNFRDLISAIEDVTKVKATDQNKFSHRIIADHLRSSAFLIADGILPSNEGRGYVLRRIMRRSMRHVHQLGNSQPIMHALVPVLINLMGEVYPELARGQALIRQTLFNEETKFRETLSRGLKILEEEKALLHAGEMFSGQSAFKLYDTYGFPLDLTQDILKSNNIAVDTAGFEQSMQEQKERARKSWVGSGQTAENAIWFEVENQIGSTEFLGYSFESSEGLILALIDGANQVEGIEKLGQEFWLLANQTPFYAESGGQKGDIGLISGQDFTAKVVDTKKFLGLHAHLCLLESGKVVKNTFAYFAIDGKYRANLKRNHTATHLLHAALKQVLGEQVIQKGSLVAHDKLRFDINHHQQISTAEIELIEQIVNNVILENLEVQTCLMNKEAAVDSGALALFGEKYADEVRVVSVAGQERRISVELCGGTHVARIGDIGLFKIISESSIASGVRRLEAVSGEFAIKYVQQSQRLLNNASNLLQVGRDGIENKITDIISQLSELQKQFNNAQTKLITQDLVTASRVINFGDCSLYQAFFHDQDAKILKSAIEDFVKQNADAVVVVINSSSKASAVLVASSPSVQNNYPAADLLKKIISTLAGNGGGSKAFAQGSFTDKRSKDEVLAIVENQFKQYS